MSPFLDNDPVAFHPQAPAVRLARGLLQGSLVFTCIRSQKLREIGVNQSIPGNGEYNAGWRNVFPNGGRIGFDFMNRVPISDRDGTPAQLKGPLYPTRPNRWIRQAWQELDRRSQKLPPKVRGQIIDKVFVAFIGIEYSSSNLTAYTKLNQKQQKN